MNCANHADTSAVAYCRTCGKALCANCTRPVRGVIYCEDCLATRVEGTVPPSAVAAGVVPPSGAAYATPPLAHPSGPNPALAGILGAIPFGVGAVYNGQYAKGLAHLVIFALLVAGTTVNGDVLPTVCGIGIAFFVIYQIVDAVRSARAIQSGQPAPDPFGLAQSFSPVDRVDVKKVPAGAVVLILLGVLFLLHTLGLAEFGLDRFWPIILIVLGGWLLARNLGVLGETGVHPSLRSRRMMGPVILLTLGILFLLSNLRVANFDRTWPVILLVIGGVKLLQTSALGGPPVTPPDQGSGPTGAGTVSSEAPPNEVSHG